MNKNSRQNMQTFTLKNMPNLDTCVLAALELFTKEKIPKLPVNNFKRPLVIGSGNAEATGKIVFKDHDAVFGNENSFNQKLKVKGIDSVFVFSASGGKHAPIMAKAAKKKKLPVFLVTNNEASPAAQVLQKTEIFIFPKNREPYTYNTSTYLGMILGKTLEHPTSILEVVKSLKIPNLKKYKAFYLILPPEFELMRDMLDKKFVEMFGRKVPYSIYTSEYIKHATTIVQRPDELYVSFGGDRNKTWGKHRLHLPLPKHADYAAMMAVSYYFMGYVQQTRPAWFKQNLESYCIKVSKVFGQEINPIVG